MKNLIILSILLGSFSAAANCDLYVIDNSKLRDKEVRKIIKKTVRNKNFNLKGYTSIDQINTIESGKVLTIYTNESLFRTPKGEMKKKHTYGFDLYTLEKAGPKRTHSDNGVESKREKVDNKLKNLIKKTIPDCK